MNFLRTKRERCTAIFAHVKCLRVLRGEAVARLAMIRLMGSRITRTTSESPGLGVAIAGLAALAAAIGVGRFAFTPLLPMMQADYHLSVAAGGWLASANYAGYLVGALSVMVLPVRPGIAIRAGL